MSGPALVQCLTCAHVGYPRKDGTPRNHPEPGPGRAGDRPICTGSGMTGHPVERTTGKAS